MKKITLMAATFAVLFGLPLSPLAGAEHPEHPMKSDATKGEHAEHPKKVDQEASMADISAGIKKHIASERKKSPDGKMQVDYNGKKLALDLVKVHEDRLSSLGGGKFFACVDMKAADNTIYDIDFFLTGKPRDMKVTETSVHKINSKPLYNWHEEEGGTWKKVEVKG